MIFYDNLSDYSVIISCLLAVCLAGAMRDPSSHDRSFFSSEQQHKNRRDPNGGRERRVGPRGGAGDAGRASPGRRRSPRARA